MTTVALVPMPIYIIIGLMTLAGFCYGAYLVVGDDAVVARWMGAVLLVLLL